jgi:hypothetical protein
MAFGLLILQTADYEWVEVDRTNLIEITDAKIDSDHPIYLHDNNSVFCYTTNTPQGLVINRVPANNCRIIYTNANTLPYVATSVPQIESNFIRWAFGDGNNHCKKSYTFYLPEGSVITDYYDINFK